MENLKIIFKNLLFVFIIPGTVGGYLPLYIGRCSAGAAGWWQWLGLPLLVAGFGILLLCVWDFTTKGRGTPLPLDPTENLVTNRLYRYTRNPMYVGVLTAIAGWAVWFMSGPVLLYGLVVGAMFGVFVFLVEEPMLQEQFGNAYEEYCRRVPRWF